MITQNDFIIIGVLQGVYIYIWCHGKFQKNIPVNRTNHLAFHQKNVEEIMSF